MQESSSNRSPRLIFNLFARYSKLNFRGSLPLCLYVVEPLLRTWASGLPQPCKAPTTSFKRFPLLPRCPSTPIEHHVAQGYSFAITVAYFVPEGESLLIEAERLFLLAEIIVGAAGIIGILSSF